MSQKRTLSLHSRGTPASGGAGYRAGLRPWKVKDADSLVKADGSRRKLVCLQRNVESIQKSEDFGHHAEQ